MKKLILGILLCCAFTSYSQNKSFKISGTLISEEDKQPLEAATVYLQRVKDSSLVTYTITDQKGKFILENKTTDKELNLFVSYIGFQTYKKKMAVKEGETNLNVISLKASTNQLDEVVVKSAAPVTIKKDTVEFNVNSFKTKKDANVEDVLKELPGVEIDDAGKITVNGKEVSNILVNGKPFFGNDPTITTRNLSKDMIQKIQITDQKTKSQAFTGEASDSDNKTINLTIKEDKNRGIFGRISGGKGTDDRYEAAGMLNMFDNDQRVSLLAGGNNTNSPGFSFGEIQKMFGGSGFSFGSGGSFVVGGRSFGGGQGITTSKNIGFNYADDYGEKVEISTDYFFSDSKSENESSTQRENILPDARYFTNSNSNSVNDNSNHRANIELEIELDSTLRIDIEPSFSTSRNIRTLYTDEESRDENRVVTNESTSDSYIENNANNFSNELSITKKFGSKGSFLRVRLDNDINRADSQDLLNSQTEVYGDNPETITRNQLTEGDEKLNRFSSNIQYRLPLSGNKLFLDFRYTYSRDKQNDVRSTFDFNDVTQAYDNFNTALSTDFEYVNSQNEPGLRLNYRTKKTTFNIGSSYVFRTLENKDFLRPQLNLERDFKNFEAYSRFRHRFSPKSSFSVSYRLNSRTPSVRQLQPFQDVTDPLNTVTGNPNLEPSNTHSVNLSYNNYNFQKGTGYYIYARSDFDRNRVISNTLIDENFVRNTTYANVNGNYSISGGGGYNKRFKVGELKTFRVEMGLWSSLNKNINFNNGVKYASKTASITPRVGFTFDWKNVMEIRPNYNISFSKSTYDIARFSNQEFLRHQVGLRTATFFPKKLEWRNDINYSYNPDVADGFQKSAWFWNATVSYTILKDKGMISLKAYDLLNQNTNARRIATQNYIQDSQSTVLQQYFMLSFSWKFNSMGANSSKGGMRPPPPPM
jgi:uncharacterized membrane protein YgcG